MRVVPLCVLVPVVVAIACEDDAPTDCSDAGGLCYDYYFGADRSSPQRRVTCEERLYDKAQCPNTLTKNPNGPFTGCCVPRKCDLGRGVCYSPCEAAKTIVDDEPDCEFGGLRTACCLP